MCRRVSKCHDSCFHRVTSLTIFIGRGYSETLGFGLSDNFHFGGYSETLGFGLSIYDNFHFRGGVF